MRGPGLMAGSPGGIAKPGFVTVPTPKPARNCNVPSSVSCTVVTTSVPCVTSGSSPPSLTTVARASVSDSTSTDLTGTSIGVSCGLITVTRVGYSSCNNAIKAAFIPAVAQEPVV